MKPNIHLLLLGLLLTTTLTAQNPENNKILRGKVLFQNSNFTPATGVAVAGMIKVEKEENTNKVYSDSRGNYELQFPLARKGHPVSLSIGNTDKTGQELEVVNEKEISLCRIPANASQEFEIIVCPKGARDVAARKYYKILKNSAEKAYEQMQEEFRALTEAQNKDYNSIQQVADDLTKLQEQIYDSIAIYKEAMAIASINKDGVNDRVLNYLKLLDEGKSIQEARKELSISKASNDMEQGIILFRAGVKELEERARASAAVFDYKDAVVCYDTLIGKAEKLNIDQLELSGYYLEAGAYNQDNGDYQKALENAEKAVEIRERIFESMAIEMAYAYNAIALVYKDLGMFQKALNKQKKAQIIFESSLNPNHPDLATLYNNISAIYQGIGDFKNAIENQEKALKIRAKNFKDNRLLGTSYNNYAAIYILMGNFQESLHYLTLTLTIYESCLEPYHPDLASVYSNLAAIYVNLGRYNDALKYQLKDIEIRESILEINHPSLGISYSNLGMIYIHLKNYGEALKQQLKAIKINESVLPQNHPQLAISYNNLATIYIFFNRLHEALEIQQKAIKIQRTVLGNNDIQLASFLNIASSILIRLEEYELAKENQLEAIKIYESNLNINHPYLSTSYHNMSNIYFLLGDYESCIFYMEKSYHTLQKSFSNDHPNTKQVFNTLLFVHKKIAEIQISNQKYSEALKSLDTVTKYQNDVEAWNLKGQCHYNLKQYPNTITSYQKAMEIDSTFSSKDYYNNIGLAYARNHQFPEAKAAFEEYQKLYPKEGRPYRNWAMYYALQDQREEALENLEKAIAQGYKDLQWLETDDSMENLRNEPGFKALLE
jgi:tetratricopeptide (TPR) repeat protein